MKAKRLAITLFLLVLFQTCRPDEPLYNPSISSMSIAGFGSEDVQIDQLRREISITMPATISSTSLRPAFLLTSEAEIIAGLAPDGTLDLSNYCPCAFGSFPGSSLPTLTLRSKSDGMKGEYRIRFKAKAPLTIKFSATPLVYSKSDMTTRGVIVPVENYYGSQAIRKVTITNADTGQSAYTSADGSCMNDCSAVGLNKMTINLNFFLRDIPYGFGPSFYTVELSLNDGTTIKTPQPIQVVP